MKKKLLTVALAAVMAVSSAITSFAATIDVDCSGWWVAHSQGFEVTAEGVTVEFSSKTYDTATANWNTPIYVLYSADAANEAGKIVSDGAGYVEYFVMRSDNYGWAGAGIANADYVGKNTADGMTDCLVSEGVPADDAAWAEWLAANKAGVNCTLTAKLDGSNAVVTLENNGVKTTATIPVDTSKTVYVSLGGELCKLGDKIVADEPATDAPVADEPATDAPTEAPTDTKAPDTGDATMVGALVAAAAISAVVVLKKRAIAE